MPRASRRTRVAPIAWLLVLGAAVLACGGTPIEEGAAPPAGGELPGGHPPIDGPPPGAVPPPPAGSGTGATGMAWSVPEGWVEETPRSSMRRAQYRIEGDAGTAECVVFYFGPGQGGDAEANALRWADQFDQPDGSSSRDHLKTESIEVGGLSVLLVEVTGTYGGGGPMMGGASEPSEGQALLGAIAEGPDANWFFKLTGPEETVFSERQAFRAMIESLRAGGAIAA